VHNTLVTDIVDSVVIGAGVVGLAIARALAHRGDEVIVLERNARIGEETSSRNSEVIHAGIYYQTGSLKAQLCVAGKQQLYEYLESKGLAHDRMGKIIVAVDEQQESRLDALAQQAVANGVRDLERLDRQALSRLEPMVRGVSGLWSPSTGIVDSHALMLSLQADIESASGAVATRAAVVGSDLGKDGICLMVDNDGTQSELLARTVVNAAGLGADAIARALPTCANVEIPQIHWARGNYFLYSGQSPFEHLVYPLPVTGGLGIHATLDLAGKLRFGPDVEWVDELDYVVDDSRAGNFYEAIRDYWPDLPDNSLRTGYAGIRPKLTARSDAAADFQISIAAFGGPVRAVHLFGIESPGLTASLAIADHVTALLAR